MIVYYHYLLYFALLFFQTATALNKPAQIAEPVGDVGKIIPADDSGATVINLNPINISTPQSINAQFPGLGKKIEYNFIPTQGLLHGKQIKILLLGIAATQDKKINGQQALSCTRIVRNIAGQTGWTFMQTIMHTSQQDSTSTFPVTVNPDGTVAIPQQGQNADLVFDMGHPNPAQAQATGTFKKINPRK